MGGAVMQWRTQRAVPSFWRYIARGTTLAIPLRWLVCERLEVSLCPLLHSAAPRARKAIGRNVFRVWEDKSGCCSVVANYRWLDAHGCELIVTMARINARITGQPSQSS